MGAAGAVANSRNSAGAASWTKPGNWAGMAVRDSTPGVRIALIFPRAMPNNEATAASMAEKRVAAPAGAELSKVRPAVCAPAPEAPVPSRGPLFVELLSFLAISVL